MSLQEFQKEKREKIISIRISSRKKIWIEEHQLNPSLFFNKKLDELMEEEDAKERF